MNYIRKLHMVCLGRVEFELMFKKAKEEELLQMMLAKSYSVEEIQADPAKMHEIVDSVNAEMLKDKDETELFIALFCHLGAYPDGSDVCFVLKDDVDPRKNKINTLDELKNSIKESSPTDFAIMSDDGLRQFQLKRYRGNLTTDDLFTFIKKKINHYGKDLGSSNLLILLQPEDGSEGDIDWDELNVKIKEIGIKSEIEVVISFNEKNEHDVIISVYPEVVANRRKRTEEFTWHNEGREQ